MSVDCVELRERLAARMALGPQLEAHLAGCQDCAELWAAERAVTAAALEHARVEVPFVPLAEVRAPVRVRPATWAVLATAGVAAALALVLRASSPAPEVAVPVTAAPATAETGAPVALAPAEPEDDLAVAEVLDALDATGRLLGEGRPDDATEIPDMESLFMQ